MMMKKTNYIQGALLQATFVAAVLLMVSCSNSQKPVDTKTIAQNQNDEKFNDRDREKDADFIVDAAEINMEQTRPRTRF